MPAFDRPLLLMEGGRIRFSLSLVYEEDVAFPARARLPHVFFESVLSLSSLLNSSPTGRALLRAAVESDVSIGLDTLLEPSSFFFYPHLRHFDLGYQPDPLQKTEKGQTRYLSSFVGGLRRAWHQETGAAATVSLRVEDFLRQFRHTEADIDAVLLLVAWELRGAGYGALWRYLLSGQSADLAAVFEARVTEDPRAQFDGRALKAAFDHWFADRERVNAADHLALEMVDMALLMPGASERLAKEGLSPQTIEKTGLLPKGKNYLAGCTLKSNWYQGLDDGFNRAHLTHILRDLSKLNSLHLTRNVSE